MATDTKRMNELEKLRASNLSIVNAVMHVTNTSDQLMKMRLQTINEAADSGNLRGLRMVMNDLRKWISKFNPTVRENIMKQTA
jgi:hypothetical protein